MNNDTAKIKLVIFDWAGTTVDFGSRAPAAAFTGVFADNGITVSDQEAREPMGLNKREHLVAMLSQPAIASRWEEVHGRPWNEQDVDSMYAAFVPIQLEAIQKHAELVPGLLEAVEQLRSQEIQIAGTTGYFKAAAAAVAVKATAAGYTPDANFCADDVPQGRPAPWMIYRAMESLGVFPPSSVVKVGDTVADIQSGLSAGCWSIGVCDSSSLVGLSLSQLNELDADQREAKLANARETIMNAGAHAVIDTIADLPQLLSEFGNSNQRLEASLN